MKETEVVAALIWDGGKFMACRRPAEKARGLLWEFAGGKVEPGETREAALVRECREELGVTVAVGSVYMALTHAYPDLTVRLTLFNASITQGAPRPLEHQTIRFLSPEEAGDYEFCPADEPILRQLRVHRVYERLEAMGEESYRAFQAKLMPTVAPERILGIRVPRLRALAKELRGSPDVALFLRALPHRYYDEDMLHALLLSEERDYAALIPALDEFLPHVDNWAVCDILSPVIFKKRPAALLGDIRRWMADGYCYTIRFGVEMLMSFYLDDAFRPEYLDWVAALRSGEYYVNMMLAWFFATALAKQYDAALPYLEQRRLDMWTHNKTIQKAVESYRITPEQKAYLRTLRIGKGSGA